VEIVVGEEIRAEEGTTVEGQDAEEIENVAKAGFSIEVVKYVACAHII